MIRCNSLKQHVQHFNTHNSKRKKKGKRKKNIKVQLVGTCATL